MNPRQILTPQEVKDFFSATNEFKVEDAEDCLRISYTENGKTTSSLIWTEAINFQQLIRKIHQLTWNHCNNILD